MRPSSVGRAGAVIVAFWLSTVPAAAAAQPGRQLVEVTVDPATVTVDLGEQVDIVAAVTNPSTEPVEGLIAHIDVTSFDSAGSVDPEDWTATLSKPVGTVDAGATATVGWTVQPIAPGRFVLYAVALRADDDRVAASGATIITVTDRRTLDPQGILPVALAVPGVLGAVLADRWRRDRLVR